MKNFIACIFAFIAVCPLCVSSAFGAISRAIPSVKSETDTKVTTRGDTARGTVARATTARTDASEKKELNTVVRSGARVIDTSNTTTGVRGTVARAVGQSSVASRATQTRSENTSARAALDNAVNTVGRNARVNAASLNSNPAVRRAGLSLRPTTAEVGGRAKISGTDIQTGSNIASDIRGVQSRAAASVAPSAESIANAKLIMEQTADLNASCQQQYNDCMDQFCAVVDANQKRCSCSSNLSSYAKVETAVKDANNQLNEVAQRIRYVGLSADEIRAILSETEAEEALSGKKDTSETRNMLEEIEALIKSPGSKTSYSSDTGMGLDLDLDFSSDSFDMFNLDFLNNDTGSMSNLRGTNLYNAAKKRCNSILTQCKDAGATSQQIMGNYELAIDKDCIAYEQGLTKMNETLKTNVRSANNMLQKARLAVLQNKNQYDAKGCIGALETCMTDDMVCGAGYEKCLDPTKQYIDENGKVVLGKNISNITEFMKDFNNASINSDTLSTAYGVTIDDTSCKSDNNNNNGDGRCNMKYLLQKIGTKAKVTDEGLCRAVLDKCQNYTYDSNGNYLPYNDVVVNYVQRAMVNIKAAQQRIISDYASSCMVDIAACYNQQVSQINSWSSSASVDSVYKVMKGACRNVALTCAYAVFYKDTTSCPAGDEGACIDSISQMFYESLLCPENSVFTKNDCGSNEECANKKCKCIDDYEAFGGACLKKCATNQTRNSYGVCQCASGFKSDGKGGCEAAQPS